MGRLLTGEPSEDNPNRRPIDRDKKGLMDKRKLQEISDRVFKDFVSRRPARILRDDIPTFMQFPHAKRPEQLTGANAAFIGVPYEGVKSFSPEILYPPEAGDAPVDDVYWRTGVAQAPEWVSKWFRV